MAIRESSVAMTWGGDVPHSTTGKFLATTFEDGLIA